MSNGYIKLNRSPDAEEIIRAYPPAWIVLTIVAMRAKRTNGFSAIGLKPGEALMGDYQSTGLSRRQYRTALDKLKEWGLVTTKPTTKGTIVTLSGSAIYDINSEGSDHQTGQQPTKKGPATDHQATTNKNDNKEKRKEGKEDSNEAGKPPPSPKKFKHPKNIIPPTKAMVWEYVSGGKLKWDKNTAGAFFDHYEANGWTQGRQSKRMKDWQAAARQWDRRRAEFGQGTNKISSWKNNEIK